MVIQWNAALISSMIGTTNNCHWQSREWKMHASWLTLNMHHALKPSRVIMFSSIIIVYLAVRNHYSFPFWILNCSWVWIELYNFLVYSYFKKGCLLNTAFQDRNALSSWHLFAFSPLGDFYYVISVLWIPFTGELFY